MNMAFAEVNWLAVLVGVIVGQAVLTLWFAVFFATPWAREYGVASKKQHAAEIPPFTYGVGLVCMILLTLGLALLQRALGVQSTGDGLSSGLFVALMFCVATALPGYAFLKRWQAFLLAISAQVVVIMLLSVLLAVWR